MNPSGTLVLSPPGSEQGEERRRGPTGLQMPRNPTGLKMPEEENPLPSRFDRNIEKVYPVLGHRFVAKVGWYSHSMLVTFICFFRPSNSLSTVLWTGSSYGVLGNK